VKVANQKRVEMQDIQELDTQVNLAKVKNKCLLSAITILINEVPEISHLLEGPMAQNGIRPMSRPMSVASSRSSRG